METSGLKNRFVYIIIGIGVCCFYNILSAQDSLTVIFAGDAMMHQTQIDNTFQGDTFALGNYFSRLNTEIRSADVAVVNLEVTLGGKPYSGYPAFSAPDEFAEALQRAGFNFYLLANNHILDRGSRGILRTIATLDSLRIPYIGVYADSVHRKRSCPYLLRKNGFRIIMLNYTYDTNGIRPQPPRMVNYIDKEQIAADITEAKLFNPDFIIANMHWGREYDRLPSKEQRYVADWLAEQGVDLILGSHPHVVQPMELRRYDGTQINKLIVYSLGNFISNMSREHTNGGVLLKVVLRRDGLKRTVSSAHYALIYNHRYLNDQGKEDIQVVPAVSWLEKHRRDSIPENYLLEQFIVDTRKLLKDNNIGVCEYFFE